MEIIRNVKTMDDLFNLHESLSSKLDAFKELHPEFDYHMQMFIGESDHKIIIDITGNADRITGNDSQTGSEVS